ncbi:retention module-containing protein, partial [Andreprevotia sp. IGB-42]|uniref:retention module-containing protein n=1 Tax=Andreprevotia sp. IGB-42 TaxID=2497473 RepID=UPI001F270427
MAQIAAHATLVSVNGQAYLRDATGKLTPLRQGQEIQENEVLVTTANGEVVLLLPNGEVQTIGPDRSVLVDAQFLAVEPHSATDAALSAASTDTAAVNAVIAQGGDLSQELEATAAGLGGGAGAGDDTHSFIRLARISEDVTPTNIGGPAATSQPEFQNTTFGDGTPAQTAEAGSTAVPNRPPVLVDNNGAPLGATQSASTPEDTPVSGRLAATDADGDALTFDKASDPAHGTVTVDANGNWTYTPASNYNGEDSFTVTVSDGKGGTDTVIVNVGVTPVNDVPVLVDGNGNPQGNSQSVTTPEDTPVSGALAATDADGDALTFSKATDPAHGSVTVDANGGWTYTPAKDYNGNDSFTVTVSDGKGGTDTITVNVGVTPVNDAPVGADRAVTTLEDTPVSGVLTATDADGDALTFTKGTDPAHGTVTVGANGNWTYTPASNYNGNDSFTVTVSDGKGGTDTV